MYKCNTLWFGASYLMMRRWECKLFLSYDEQVFHTDEPFGDTFFRRRIKCKQLAPVLLWKGFNSNAELSCVTAEPVGCEALAFRMSTWDWICLVYSYKYSLHHHAIVKIMEVSWKQASQEVGGMWVRKCCRVPLGTPPQWGYIGSKLNQPSLGGPSAVVGQEDGTGQSCRRSWRALISG